MQRKQPHIDTEPLFWCQLDKCESLIVEKNNPAIQQNIAQGIWFRDSDCNNQCGLFKAAPVPTFLNTSNGQARLKDIKLCEPASTSECKSLGPGRCFAGLSECERQVAPQYFTCKSSNPNSKTGLCERASIDDPNAIVSTQTQCRDPCNVVESNKHRRTPK